MIGEFKDSTWRKNIKAAIQRHCTSIGVLGVCGRCQFERLCETYGTLWTPDLKVPDTVLVGAMEMLAAKAGGETVDAAHDQPLGQQPIETMQKILAAEQFLDFLHGNIIKYALRCGHKDNPVREIENVRQYAHWYIKATQGEIIDPRRAA